MVLADTEHIVGQATLKGGAGLDRGGIMVDWGVIGTHSTPPLGVLPGLAVVVCRVLVCSGLLLHNCL